MDGSTEDTDVDRLNDLPEVILHHIFSFLNMKQAVQTCVLSRRWRKFWASLPFLNLDKELVKSFNSTEESTAFRDFVDHVLLQRDNTCILRFHIDCNRINHLNAWILYLIKHNVQELSIAIRDGWNSQELQLLHGLFTCTSLKVLELNINAHLKYILPHTINLPVLQTLLLHGLSFTSGVDSFDKLFYACPILESLTINECRIFFFHLNISSSKLRTLVINQKGLSNVGDDLECALASVKVYAPNLLSFRCKDDMLMNYSLENLSSLVKADISLGNDKSLSAKRMEHYSKSMIKILRAIQNVTTLTLSASDAIFQIFSETDALEGAQFCNLRCLKFSAINSMNLNWWIKAMTCLLRVSPNIETVSLTGEMSDSTDIGDYEEAGLSLGKLKHLKFVEFNYGGTGGVNEFKFLENLVSNVVALKKLVIVFLPLPISFGSYIHRKRFGEGNIHRKRFSEELLLALPTASSSSRVEMWISKSNKHFVATYSFFL